MKKEILRTSSMIILLLLLLQLINACSAIGYYIGKSNDESKVEIELDKYRSIEPNTEIKIFLINNIQVSGLYKYVSNDSFQLINDKPIAIADIREIQLQHEPTKGRVTGTIVGGALDIIVTYTVISSSMNAIKGG